MVNEELSEPELDQKQKEQLISLMRSIGDLIASSSYEMNTSVTGLNLDMKGREKQNPGARSLSIDQINFDGGWQKISEKNMNLHNALEFRGVEFSSVKGLSNLALPDLSQDFYPKNFRAGMSIEQFPFVTLFERVISLMEQDLKAGEDVQGKILGSSQGFLQQLEETGTKFEINNTYVGNDLWLALLNGDAKVNTEALYKLVGESELRLYGLDRLLALISAELENPEVPPQTSKMMQNAMAGLSMMQMFGQQKTDEQGNTYRGYTLTITPDGKTELNGTDINQLIGSVQQR
jgi:hypothetical protein